VIRASTGVMRARVGTPLRSRIAADRHWPRRRLWLAAICAVALGLAGRAFSSLTASPISPHYRPACWCCSRSAYELRLRPAARNSLRISRTAIATRRRSEVPKPAPPPPVRTHPTCSPLCSDFAVWNCCLRGKEESSYRVPPRRSRSQLRRGSGAPGNLARAHPLRYRNRAAAEVLRLPCSIRAQSISRRPRAPPRSDEALEPGDKPRDRSLDRLNEPDPACNRICAASGVWLARSGTLERLPSRRAADHALTTLGSAPARARSRAAAHFSSTFTVSGCLHAVDSDLEIGQPRDNRSSN